MKLFPTYYFHGLAPASSSNQLKHSANSAIFGKIGGKTINLAGTFIHNGALKGGMNSAAKIRSDGLMPP